MSTLQQSSPQPPKGLGDKTYNLLKLIALVLLPGLQALYFGVAELWNLPHTDAVVATIALVNTFLGVLVKFSQMLHDASKSNDYDGTFTLEPTEDGANLRLLSVDPVALQTKGTVVFKMLDPPAA